LCRDWLNPAQNIPSRISKIKKINKNRRKKYLLQTYFTKYNTMFFMALFTELGKVTYVNGKISNIFG